MLREAAVESRFEAMHAQTMTPMIGRDEELELLLRRWRQAQEGEGQLVLLSGEPGIGKSRLIAACTSGCVANHTITFVISVHHTIRTARSIRSSRVGSRT